MNWTHKCRVYSLTLCRYTTRTTEIEKNNNFQVLVWGQSWRRGTEYVVGSIPTQGDKIFTYTYIFISSLWCLGKVRRWVLPLNMQSLQNSAENGKRCVLTLSSLCLLCAGFSVKLIYFQVKMNLWTKHFHVSLQKQIMKSLHYNVWGSTIIHLL